MLPVQGRHTKNREPTHSAPFASWQPIGNQSRALRGAPTPAFHPSVSRQSETHLHSLGASLHGVSGFALMSLRLPVDECVIHPETAKRLGDHKRMLLLRHIRDE
jgi:hypothetical protein